MENNVERLDYGFDGSPIRLPMIGLLAWLVGLALLFFPFTLLKIIGLLVLIIAVLLTLLVAKMFHYVHIGKFKLRNRIFSMVTWTGKESVLDVGTGRGLLMIGAAKKLTSGKSVGIDIWREEDMKNNNPRDTLKNVELEGMTEKVELRNEDVQKMTFSAGTFDVILSNLCIHNIPTKEGRETACREIVRVLKPQGVIVISDMLHLDDYGRIFKSEGLAVEILKPSFFESSTPWHRIVKATKGVLAQ